MKFWQKALTTTACLSLAVAGFPTPSNAQVGYESTCREVATRRSDLNVRATPGGRIIGSLSRGTTVVIGSEIGDWVPITAPLDGYVSARYLEYCGDNAPAGANTNTVSTNPGVNASSCREISQRKVAPVRENPSATSRIINTLQPGRQVTIQNLGASGWVPVLEPIEGYVSSTVLTYCD